MVGSDDDLLNEAFLFVEDDPTTANSTLHQHMVRAIYFSLRKRGQGAKPAAQGAFKIATSCLQNNGMMGAGDSGRLTGHGARRSRRHAQEPKGTLATKARDFKVVKSLAQA